MDLKLIFVVFVGSLASFSECDAQSKIKYTLVSLLEEPYLMRENENDAKVVGFCADLITEIALIVGFDYEIRIREDGRYGYKENGTGVWNGLMGEITGRHAHMAVAPLTISEVRAKDVLFTTPFQDFRLSILLNKPEDFDKDLIDQMITCFDPFTVPLWITVICAIFFVVFVSLVIEWSFKSPDTHGEGLVNFLRQDSIFKPESVTGKVLRFFYLVFLIIVIGGYIASFSAKRNAGIEHDVEIKSVEDLVRREDYRFGIIKGGATENYLKTSNIPVYQELINTMYNENTLVDNYAHGLERLRTNKDEKFAFLIETPKAEYFEGRTPCDFVTAKNQFGPSRGYGIAIIKENTALWDNVNNAILKLKENGKLEQLVLKWWNDVGCIQKSAVLEVDKEDNTVTLTEMSAAFFFLLGGLIIILLCWFWERSAISK